MLNKLLGWDQSKYVLNWINGRVNFWDFIYFISDVVYSTHNDQPTSKDSKVPEVNFDGQEKAKKIQSNDTSPSEVLPTHLLFN